MSVPAFLFAVDREIYFHAVVRHPFADDFVVVHEVVLRSCAVYDLYGTVVFTVVTYIVDDRTERCQTDTARDEQKVLALQFRFHRERLAVRSADRDLLSYVHRVQPFRQAAALLDGEFHIVLVRRRGCDREHRFPYPRDRQHCALTGHMFERLHTVRSEHAERLYVRRVDADVRYLAEIRDQSFVIHFSPSSFASFFITFTIFMLIGHDARQRPQPTQPYSPSLFAGKYTSLCMNL